MQPAKRQLGGLVHLLALLLFVFLAFVLGRIPSGSVVAQGDFFQTTQLSGNLSTNLFTWFHLAGQGQYNPLITTWPFYAVQAVLSGAGVSDTHIAEYLQLQFLVLSYGSVVAATRLGLPLLGRLRTPAGRAVAGLAYTLNPITFNIAAQSWGYLHYLLFYAALPVLIALTWRLLVRPTMRFTLAAVLVDACATVSFNNVAWFYVLILVQIVVLVVAVLQREARLRSLVGRLAGVVVGETVLAAYVLGPFATGQSSYAGKARNTVAFGGDAGKFIKQTSSPLAQVAMFDIYGKYHFPGLDVLPGGRPVTLVVEIAALLPLVLIVAACFRSRCRPVDLLRPAIGLCLVTLLLLLVARIEPPLGRVLLPLLTSSAFILLRSPEKVYVLLPLVLLLATGAALQAIRSARVVRVAVAVTVTALALPFLLGGVHRYLTVELASDLTTVTPDGYSQAVRIPADYDRAAAISNLNPADGPVLSVPYSSMNSVNWSNYPAWHFVGANLLSDLFRRPVVIADTPDHPTLETRMSFEEFDQDNGTPAQYLAQLQRFGARYVLFHKDISAGMLAASQPTQRALAVLTATGVLARVFTGPDIDLYLVAPADVTAPVTLTSGASYRQQSPVEYDVDAPHLAAGDVLTLRQAQDPSWKVYALPVGEATPTCPGAVTFAASSPAGARTTMQCGTAGRALDASRGLRLQFQHPLFAASQRLTDSYQATWTVDPAQVKALGSRYYEVNPDGTLRVRLVVYFAPQSSFYDGLLILALAVLGSAVGLIILAFTRRRRVATAGS